MINDLMYYAGHIMRNTSGHYDTLLSKRKRRRQGKRGSGRPRRTWVDDLRDWTGSKRYDQIKRAAQMRDLEHLQPTAVDATMNEQIVDRYSLERWLRGGYLTNSR